MTTLSRTSEPGATAPRRREPLLAASAAASFAVTVAVLLIPHDSLPDGATAAQATAFFSEHYRLQQSQTVMHSLGAVAMLVFFTQLASVVRRLERPGEIWGRLVLAAGSAVVAVVVATMGFVSAVIFLTGTLAGDLQSALYMIGWDFHFKIAYLVPLVLLPACHVLRREHAAPAAVTWSGLGLGALTLASTLGNLSKETMFVQYPVFLLFLVWMLAAGLTLGLRGSRASDGS